MSRRKRIVRAKLKVARQEERKHLWKQHFDNLLRKPLKVRDEEITNLIINEQDIKLEQFTQEELASVLRKIKNRKSGGLDEIPPNVWKNGDSTIYCSDTATLHIIRTKYTDGQRDASSLSPRGVTLELPRTSKRKPLHPLRPKSTMRFYATTYNPKLIKIHGKNPNGFRMNRSTTSSILTIRRVLQGFMGKKLKQKYYSSTSSRHLTPDTERWSKYFMPTTSSKKPSQPYWCNIKTRK